MNSTYHILICTSLWFLKMTFGTEAPIREKFVWETNYDYGTLFCSQLPKFRSAAVGGGAGTVPVLVVLNPALPGYGSTSKGKVQIE